MTEFAFGVRQAEAGQVDVLAPGLADIALKGFLARFAMGGGMLGNLTQEYRGRLLQVIAKGEALTEGLEALVADCDRGRAEEIQRTGGDIGRDQRVASRSPPTQVPRAIWGNESGCSMRAGSRPASSQA